MSEQQLKTLRAEKLPERINVRRTKGGTRRSALGMGLGALLLRQQLAASAKQMPKLKLPVWASGFEAPQREFVKKVLRKAITG